MPLKLRHEGAEIMTNEEPLKQNYHSENHKSEIDSNNNVLEIRQRLAACSGRKKKLYFAIKTRSKNKRDILKCEFFGKNQTLL